MTYHVVHAAGQGAQAETFLAYLETPSGQALIDEVMVAIPPQRLN